MTRRSPAAALARISLVLLLPAICAVSAASGEEEAAEPFAYEHGLACLAFSPDGTLAAGGCPRVEPYVIVWDAKTGRKLHRFPAVHHVTSVGFTPDSRTAFGVSLGGMDHIEAWDLGTGKLAAKFKIPYEGDFYTCRARTSPDGARIATGGLADGLCRVYSLPDGKLEHALEGHAAAVWSYAFSPDGKALATASADGTVRLWDVASGKETRKLEGHESGVLDVAFAEKGRRVVSVSGDGEVRAWRAKDGKSLSSFRIEGMKAPREASIHSPLTAALSADGSRAVGKTAEGFRGLDAAKGKELCLVPAKGGPRPFAVSADGKRLLATPERWLNEGGRLELFDLDTGARLLEGAK